ncbi:aminotransferase class IV [Microbulbifer sp. 2205BS26-8]|uniref:aminotransferase class IV n=1 Tax=Microbulbifer sp. 2205BS26-8 TaxID=3064386 RepID=UPI00273DA889|nr:aminotransferase class IV [Microbulbifer sp. 2205BS26-8]MDP5208264.1 aminotransferase class IV [Microbulbifer sp. 2205BS26-8]
MFQLPQLFLRGRAVPRLAPDSDYTEGILETMRCHSGSLPLWPLHRDRLIRCASLNRGLLDEIDHSIPHLAARYIRGEAVARLRIGLVGGDKCWDLSFFPMMCSLEAELGIHLFPCNTRLPISGLMNSGCKFLSRSRYNAAKVELPAGERLDGLMFDSAGRVIESLRCNLLARFDETWVTPDLQRCGVRGVMRAWLSDWVWWQERDMDIQLLSSADEVVLCNSVRGVLPVVEVIGIKNWTIGAGARRLQQLIVEELW